jgi:hypothetical protein
VRLYEAAEETDWHIIYAINLIKPVISEELRVRGEDVYIGSNFIEKIYPTVEKQVVIDRIKKALEDESIWYLTGDSKQNEYEYHMNSVRDDLFTAREHTPKQMRDYHNMWQFILNHYHKTLAVQLKREGISES